MCMSYSCKGILLSIYICNRYIGYIRRKGKMIFKYLHTIWIEKGSIVGTVVGDESPHEILQGFYAFYIDESKFYQEHPKEMLDKIDMERIYHMSCNLDGNDDDPEFPIISGIDEDSTLTIWSVPEAYGYEADDQELSIIHIDIEELRRKERFFLLGDRYVRVYKDTVELVEYDACKDKEVIELPQWMDKWALSLYDYISFKSVPSGIIFDDEGSSYRTTKDLSIMYIDVNRYHGEYFEEDDYSFENGIIQWEYEDLPNISYVGIGTERYVFFNVTDRIPYNQEVNTSKKDAYNNHIPTTRSYQIGSYTVSVTPTKVRIFPTYPVRNMFTYIPLNRLLYKDIIIKTG